ncbi:MAG: apolipoprotein N-acyltransferase [Clostridium sp.]
MEVISIKYLLTIISAVVMALTLTFDKLWIIALIGLVPYFYVLYSNKLSIKDCFKIGLTFGFTYYFVLLHWILSMHPLDRYGFEGITSIIILLVGWIFLSLYEGLWLAIIPVIFNKVRYSNRINIVILASLWIIVEWAQQIGSLGFSWGRLAISQVGAQLMIQSASLFGSLFISFILVVVNSLICYGIIYKRKSVVLKRIITVIILILTVNMGFGFIWFNRDENENSRRIAIIQGNISSNDKWNSSSLNKHLNTYLGLSYQAYNNEQLDYIVWPETAIPVTLLENEHVLNKYKELARNTNSTLIVGAYHEESEQSYNSIYAISKDGEVSEPYSKRQLVPFGEFLPFENILSKVMPFLKDINMFGEGITPGERANVLTTPKGKIGGLICFESIFPRLTRDLTKEGAELIVIGTNDSWFKDSRGVYEHLKQSVLRAVESNRYVVRAANTGVSATINNKGVVTEGIEALQQGYLVSDVKLISNNTLYTYVGDIIVFIASIFLLVIYIRKRLCLKGVD